MSLENPKGGPSDEQLAVLRAAMPLVKRLAILGLISLLIGFCVAATLGEMRLKADCQSYASEKGWTYVSYRSAGHRRGASRSENQYGACYLEDAAHESHIVRAQDISTSWYFFGWFLNPMTDIVLVFLLLALLQQRKFGL
jgi:hypothetical protein